jgi:MOSC domain-containing protein YiiM
MQEPPRWTGRIESINTSRGGVPKEPVFEAMITKAGLDGDRQRDLRFHGGPDRAVVLFSLDVIRDLQREGHGIAPGAAGENLTVSGLDWRLVVPGVEIAVGGARLVVTKHVTPCLKIARSFARGEFVRISHREHPGWSRVAARVVEEGLVCVGDPVELIATASRG